MVVADVTTIAGHMVARGITVAVLLKPDIADDCPDGVERCSVGSASRAVFNAGWATNQQSAVECAVCLPFASMLPSFNGEQAAQIESAELIPWGWL